MDEKQKKILICMDRWMTLREQGITLAKYCLDRGVRTVGIYGFGRLGRHLVWELEKEGICISWIMDQRSDMLAKRYDSYDWFAPDETCSVKDVDTVIVTALEDYYAIEAELCKYMRTDVVSLEEILGFIQG